MQKKEPIYPFSDSPIHQLANSPIHQFVNYSKT